MLKKVLAIGLSKVCVTLLFLMNLLIFFTILFSVLRFIIFRFLSPLFFGLPLPKKEGMLKQKVAIGKTKEGKVLFLLFWASLFVLRLDILFPMHICILVNSLSLLFWKFCRGLSSSVFSSKPDTQNLPLRKGSSFPYPKIDHFFQGRYKDLSFEQSGR